MFVEVAELKVIIVHLDGFICINGRRTSNFLELLLALPNESISLHPFLLELISSVLPSVTITYVSENLAIDKVEALLRQHQIFTDSEKIICPSKIEEGKRYSVLPYLKKARDTARVKSSRCAVLFSDAEKAAVLMESGLGTIFVELEFNHNDLLLLGKNYPDFYFRRGSHLPIFFGGDDVGYFGEAVAYSSINPILNYTRSVFGSTKTPLRGGSATIACEDDPEIKIITGGRFFDKGMTFDQTNPRFRKHPLSIKLIHFKGEKGQVQAKLLARIAVSLIDEAEREQVADYLFSVPQRNVPGRPDRLRTLFDQIKVINGTRFNEDKLRNDGLVLTRSISKQKGLNKQQRRENVRGAYDVTIPIAGKNIIVVDDITTTQSTLVEIHNMLLEKGARSVKLIALAFHPIRPKPRADEPYLSCSLCGTYLEAVPKKDGGIFFSCVNWDKNKPEVKHKSVNYLDAVRLLNENTDLVLNAAVENLPSIEL